MGKPGTGKTGTSHKWTAPAWSGRPQPAPDMAAAANERSSDNWWWDNFLACWWVWDTRTNSWVTTEEDDGGYDDSDDEEGGRTFHEKSRSRSPALRTGGLAAPVNLAAQCQQWCTAAQARLASDTYGLRHHGDQHPPPEWAQKLQRTSDKILDVLQSISLTDISVCGPHS